MFIELKISGNHPSFVSLIGKGNCIGSSMAALTFLWSILINVILIMELKRYYKSATQ